MYGEATRVKLAVEAETGGERGWDKTGQRPARERQDLAGPESCLSATLGMTVEATISESVV